jgi:hypothetical protein
MDENSIDLVFSECVQSRIQFNLLSIKPSFSQNNQNNFQPSCWSYHDQNILFLKIGCLGVFSQHYRRKVRKKNLE